MKYCGFTTPEQALAISADVPAGYPIDAIDCALSRADAVLDLLACQFDGADSPRLADNIISNALWAVSGELALLRKLFEHGHKTEEQRVADDLDKALAAAGQPTARRKGGAK